MLGLTSQALNPAVLQDAVDKLADLQAKVSSQGVRPHVQGGAWHASCRVASRAACWQHNASCATFAGLLHACHHRALWDDAHWLCPCMRALQARKKLFRVLAKHTDRPETLSSALACLCDHASYLMPDTPEALLAQYAGHYRCAAGIPASLAAGSAAGGSCGRQTQRASHTPRAACLGGIMHCYLAGAACGRHATARAQQPLSMPPQSLLTHVTPCAER